MTSAFNLALSHAGHFEETGEARSCEPYVLVTSIDLRTVRPAVEAFLYGPWKGADPEAPNIVPLVWRESFWRLDIVAAPIMEPDDVIFMLALMEHVGGNPGAVRTLVKNAVIQALDASAGMAREARVAKLTHSINGAVDLANGGPNFSTAIEISLTAYDVMHLNANGSRRFMCSFCGYGGHYCLSFELAKSNSTEFLSQYNEELICAAE